MRCLSNASILKKTLINNAIALAVYGVSIAVMRTYANNIRFPVQEKANPFVVMACIAALLYVKCGFFLIPMKKRLFLSAISVAIAMTITLVICMGLGEDGMVYYLLNPFVFPLLSLQIFQGTIYLLSPLYPSLLMYLGMVLRKIIAKRKAHP